MPIGDDIWYLIAREEYLIERKRLSWKIEDKIAEGLNAGGKEGGGRRGWS